MRDLVQKILELEVMLVDLVLLFVRAYARLVDERVAGTVQFLNGGAEQQTFAVVVAESTFL